MPALSVIELDNLPKDNQKEKVPALVPFVYQADVALSGTSADSAAFSETTRLVYLSSDVACRVRFDGTAPTATTGLRMSANSDKVFGVRGGSIVKAILSTV